LERGEDIGSGEVQIPELIEIRKVIIEIGLRRRHPSEAAVAGENRRRRERLLRRSQNVAGEKALTVGERIGREKGMRVAASGV